MRPLVAALLFGSLVLLPAAGAQAPTRVPAQDSSDFLLRVNGPLHIAAGDSAGTIVAIATTATVEGTVREALLVVDGTARITGTVRGNVVAMGARVELAPSARVEGDVVLYRSTLARADGARVLGAVTTTTGLSMGARAIAFFWTGMTLLLVVAALLFAALAGRQLAESAALIGHEPGHVILGALILWIGLPVTAMLVFATVIGIPLALALALFVGPALLFLGYLIAATAFGRALVRMAQPARPADDRPYLAATLGVILLQAIGLLPVLGGVVALFAALLGAGALLQRIWRDRPRRAAAPHTTSQPMAPPFAGARA